MTQAHFNIGEILKVLEPIKFKSNSIEDSKIHITTDSRLVEDGQWFIALKGNNHDGHNFIKEINNKKISGIIIDNPDYFDYKIDNIILVKNTLDAYHKLANYWLKKVNPITIAITGSSGKTTTKEICYQILKSLNKNVHATQKNENNEYGVPKTIFNMPENTQFIILELAMRGLHQIEYLAKTVQPDYGIITNAGTAHIELLGSRQKIIEAKCELFVEMNKNQSSKLAVIGENNSDLIKYAKSIYSKKIKIFQNEYLKIIESNFDTTRFEIDNQIYIIPSYGMATIQDAWCIIQVLLDANVSYGEICLGLANYKSIEGRGTRFQNSKGFIVIDETYNANPESVKSAISNLLDSQIYKQKIKLIILGHMAELGETTQSSHAEIGQWLSCQNFTHLLTVGEIAKIINQNCTNKNITNLNFDTWENLSRYIDAQNFSSEAIALIKGSRVAQLDKLVSELVKR